MQSESTGAIGSIDNAGTITGWWGIYSPGNLDTFVNRSTGVVQSNGYEAFATGKPMTSFTNEAGGTISASGYSGVVFGGDVTTVNNAGTISGNSVYTGLQVYAGTVGTLTNTGTITGGYAIENYGAITTLNNSGSVLGTGFGIYSTGSLGELTNSGTVQGSTPGMRLSGTTGSVSNLAGGRIASTFDDGIYVLGTTVTSLSNAGTIEGATGGVRVDEGGLTKLTNSGTIRYTGTGTGPAILVGSGGVLGDATGAGGAALVSTGGVALLDGEIVNRGTIHHGFTIENQNVTVSAAGGAGTFTSGTLDVGDGNLTFTGGTTTLGADVAVDGGAGTVFNEAVLAFTGARSFDGAFSQSSTGTLSSLISGESAYGSIVIDGAAAFAGTLDLDLVGGFDFAEGQTYTLFTFTSRTGGFTGLSVDGTALSSAGTGQWTYGSLILEEQWTGSSMSIAAVPEPSTLVLGAAGIACAVWMRHRRRAWRSRRGVRSGW